MMESNPAQEINIYNHKTEKQVKAKEDEKELIRMHELEDLVQKHVVHATRRA